MSKTKFLHSKPYTVPRLLAVAAAVTLDLVSLMYATPVLAQGAGSIYVSPATGSYGVGSSFTVAVRENSSQTVNAVQADMAYSNNLQFVSFDASGSAFGIDASSTGGSGSVSVARGTTKAVSGDQLVTQITFKVIAAGTGTITMQGSSEVLDATNNGNVANNRNGASYSLQAGNGQAAGPTGTPPAPATQSKGSSLPVIKVTPRNGSQATPLPGDSTIQLESPATIVTTPDPNRNVAKVEYLLNGKVIATDTTPPYTHDFDTAKYRNGTYTLTTKTYYADGKVDVSNDKLTVKNKFGPRQAWLQLIHYAWLIIILLVIVGELVYLKFFRHRRGGGGGRAFGGSGQAPFGPPTTNPSRQSARPTMAMRPSPAAGPVVRPSAQGQPAAAPTDPAGGVRQ